MVAGTGWCWESLVTDLHSGGHCLMVALLPTEAKVHFGSNFAILSRDSTAHPPWEKGLEKVIQKKLFSLNLVSLPQLTRHPIRRSIKTCEKQLQKESTTNFNVFWFVESKNTHGHW